MSKKTISFQNPSKAPNTPATPKSAIIPAHADVAADRWVHQSEEIFETAWAASSEPAEPQNVAAALTISISAEPDAFEMIKIWFLLPYLTFLFWTLGTTQRNLQLLGRWF
jgi:hypothetical protein